jgi:hypothetical protein
LLREVTRIRVFFLDADHEVFGLVYLSVALIWRVFRHQFYQGVPIDKVDPLAECSVDLEVSERATSFESLLKVLPGYTLAELSGQLIFLSSEHVDSKD